MSPCCADLLRVVVGARDRHPVLRVGEGEQVLERRGHLGVVDALLGLGDDLGGEPGPVRVVGLEQLLDVLGLAVGQREVGAVVRADRTGDGVDDDEQGHPGTDHDPAVADAGAGEGCQHGRKRYASVASDSHGGYPPNGRHRSQRDTCCSCSPVVRARRRCRDRVAPPVRQAAAPVAGRPGRSTVRATAAAGRTTRRPGPSPRRRASRRRPSWHASAAAAAVSPASGSATASAQNTGSVRSPATSPPATAASSPNATRCAAGPSRP